MLTAGGISFMFLSSIGEKFKKASLVLKAFTGSIFITALEFIFGIIFNVILKKNVWDYSKLPLNIGGQVCLLFSFMWFVLSMIFSPFASLVNKKLKG